MNISSLLKNRNFYAAALLFSVLLLIFMVHKSSASDIFDVRKVCESKKGVWREFGDDCADNCGLKGKGNRFCVPEITYSCECPKNQCWDYYQCIDDEKYQVEATKAEEERIAKLKKTNPELFIDVRVTNDKRINKDAEKEKEKKEGEETPPADAPAEADASQIQDLTLTAQISKCTSTGGTWKEFANGCADNCSNKRYPSLCVTAVTPSCDCPEDQCWDGSACILTANF